MNKQMSSLSPLPLEGGVSVAVSGGRRRSRRHRYGVGGEEPAVEVSVAGQMEGMEGARRRRRSRKAGQSEGMEGARRRRRSHKAGQSAASEMAAGRRRRHRKAGQTAKVAGRRHRKH